METKREYFPWHPFQLWLREGIFAGFVLNKLMIASMPAEERRFPPTVLSEETELLGKIFDWAKSVGQDSGSLRRLADLRQGAEYPVLSDDEARLLWRIITKYGISNERYGDLHARLRDYLAAAGDIDQAIRNGMDALWRSIGPALDQDRSNIEKAA